LEIFEYIEKEITPILQKGEDKIASSKRGIWKKTSRQARKRHVENVWKTISPLI
jgi:hypothetical protein